MIGVKTWIYKGEILDGGKRQPNSLKNESEPRRQPRQQRPPRPAGDRDRQQPTAYGAAPVEQHGLTQQAPGELPQPARTPAPITPPMASPQPSWKQELKSEGEPDKGQE